MARPKNTIKSALLAIGIVTVLLSTATCEIMPRNTLPDCQEQCKHSDKSKACYDFCDCIQVHGHPLNDCLDAYDKAPADTTQTQ